MYQPEKYKRNDPQFIYDLINKYPFATLVTTAENLLATHVPVLLEGAPHNYRFLTHIANHNPMCQSLREGKEMLLIFKGPDSYISSSWYIEPDIPTWDYTAVHVNAEIKLQTEKELQQCLEKLVHRFEKEQDDSLNLQEISSAMWEENFNNITGFWLYPFQAAGIAKLHQGFQKEDIHNITNQLDKSAGCPMRQVSELIKKQNDQ